MKIEQIKKHVSLPDNCVDKIGVAVELVLYDIVEYLEQEEHKILIGLIGEEEKNM